MRTGPSLYPLIYLLARPAVTLAAALSLSSPSTPAASDTSKNLHLPSCTGSVSTQDDSFSSTSVSNSYCVGDAAREHMDSIKPMESLAATAAEGRSTGLSVGTSTSPAAADCREVPQRFLVGCGGDEAEAARRWRATCEWRLENDIDTILERPQPRFYDCREAFPVYVHGRSKTGLPVLWERIGKVNLARADELKLPLSDLLPNYIFINECVWRVVLDKGEDRNDDAQFITVEDVEGVRLWHLTPRVLSVVRSLSGTMKAHYVERCYKSYIINAPRAFTALWRIISPMFDPRTRAKICILGTDYKAALQEEISASQLPTEYGGTSGRSIGESVEEMKVQALVARLNAQEAREEVGAGESGGARMGTATVAQSPA